MNPMTNHEKTTVASIVRRLPEDMYRTVRDISPLTCSVFGGTHFRSLPRLLPVHFRVVFWLFSNGQAKFYRSEAEYRAFARVAAVTFLRHPQQGVVVARRLREYTDWFSTFLVSRKTRQQFFPYAEHFFDAYGEFFAYHQTTKYACDYLNESTIPTLRGKQRTLIAKLEHALDRAYAYNEMVVPDVERYFAKLGIANFFYAEVIAGMPRPKKNRSIIFFPEEQYVVQETTALAIERGFEKKLLRGLKGRTFIRGLGIGKEIAEGRVRCVTQLTELRTVRPGDVVVTHMTRPQYNERIRHAAALVTDEGGALCHASILAREYGIPCIVGTKFATLIFKTGDQVRVDPKHGFVEKVHAWRKTD